MNETKSIADQRIQAQLVDWLRDGPEQGPALGLERVLSGARAVDQRPRAMFPSTWLPRSVPELQWRRPSLGLAPTLLIVTLLLVLALAAVYVGSRPHLPESLGPSRDLLVAYSNDDGAISVARVDGSGRREISGGLPGVSPVFSPDGSRVAFVSMNHGPDGGNALHVASVDRSGDPLEVSHGVSVLVNNEPQISWSPDGSAIAFAGVAIRETPAATESAVGSSIFVAQADGSQVAQITVDDMDRDLPTWATFWDGDRIAYRATALDGSSVSLGYMRPDGSDFTQIISLPTMGGSLSRVDWSPANDVNTIEVSYTVGFGFGTPSQAMIAWLGTSTTGNSNVATWTDGVDGLEGYAPAWSPDGRWIAFITAGGDVVIAENKAPAATVYNAGSYDGELRQLGNVADCWIDWSPDGTALYGGSPDGCTGTVVIPLEDPDSAFITYTPMSGVTSWQPLRP